MEERQNPCSAFNGAMCQICVEPYIYGLKTCKTCEYGDGHCVHCAWYKIDNTACENGIRQEGK